VKLLVEILGWIAIVLNLLGNEMLAKRRTAGWPVRLAANAGWMVYSVGVFAWPLFVNHIVFTVSNARGWWKWRVQDRKLKHILADKPGVCQCPGCVANGAGT
jgi:hypothetical protein